MDISAVTGTAPTLDVTVEGKDPVSGNYQQIAAFAQQNGVSTTMLIIYPGAAEADATAGLEAQDVPLPKTWRMVYTVGGTNPQFTFTVGGCYVP